MIFARFRQRVAPARAGERLLRLIDSFERSQTLDAVRRTLEKHPELLSTEADALLAQRIAVRRRQAGDAAVFDLELRRIILRRCREVAVEGALRELPLLLGDQSGDLRVDVRWWRPLIEPVATVAVAAAAGGGQEAAARVERQLVELQQGTQYGVELLRRLRRILAGERTEDLLVGLQVLDAVIVRQCLDEIAKRVVVQPPDGEDGRVLAELSGPFSQARGAMQRYHDTRDAAALDEAVTAYSAILSHPALAVEQHAFVLQVLGEAADAFLERFQAREDTADLSDLEAALSLWRDASDQSEPGAPGRTSLLAGLGRGLRALYEVNGDLGTLDQVIEVRRAAVAEASAGTLDRLSLEHDLANTLLLRYRQTGNREDLDAAIGTYERALVGMPNHAQLRALAMANLGMALRLRQPLAPDPADLERAIRLLEEAVQTTPLDADELPGFLDGLGGGLQERYERNGDVADLERAIENFGKAVAHPASGEGFALYLSNLAGAYQSLYARTNNPEHLRLAVDALNDAVRFTPPQAPDLPMRLANLGSVLVQQHEQTSDPNDLERGIAALREALRRTPSQSPEAAKRHNSLAFALWSRYRVSHQTGDLDEAIEAAEQAVNHAAAHSPELSAYLNTLAVALQEHAERTTRQADLERAVAAYQQSCQQGILTSSAVVLATARNWGNWALRRQSWHEASEAYGYGLRAASQLLRTQLLREHKEVWLYAAQGIPAFAALALAKSGDARGAVARLEQGRAFLLSEALQRDRADLDHLVDLGHDNLRDRYRQAADRIARLERAALVSSGTDAASQRTDLRAAHDDLDAAIRAIRKISGYERFLEPPTFDDVVTAAQPAPLVYLSAAETGGLALIVRDTEPAASMPEGNGGTSGGDVTTVWLPALGDSALRAQVDSYRQAYQCRDTDPATWTVTLEQVTSWLWDAVMAPVLRALGPARHAVLVPAGLLGLLPLHAAWTKDTKLPTGRRFALDQMLLTYAPNARALREALRLAERVAPVSLLAIDEPKPVRARALPNARYEAAAACAAFPSRATSISGESATRQAVADALGQASVLHFACHGYADLAIPLDSGLVLAHDQPVTLRELLTMRLAARQAVLSACETGLAGTATPDEVVALPSGMLQAGVAGVVASLWGVPDTATMLLMVAFYDRWRRQGLDPAEALRQAQRWLRDSTNGEKRRLFESLLARSDAWLPQATAEACVEAVILEDPEQRGFADAANWAAFGYVGA